MCHFSPNFVTIGGVIFEYSPNKQTTNTQRNANESITSLAQLTSCAHGNTNPPRPSPPHVVAVAPCAADRNVAAVSHAQYVPTLIAAAAYA